MQFIRTLGRGSYGEVAQCEDLEKGGLVAVKRVLNVFNSEVSVAFAVHCGAVYCSILCASCVRVVPLLVCALCLSCMCVVAFLCVYRAFLVLYLVGRCASPHLCVSPVFYWCVRYVFLLRVLCFFYTCNYDVVCFSCLRVGCAFLVLAGLLRLVYVCAVPFFGMCCAFVATGVCVLFL